jgi:RNA polymerase sigma-B factor
MEARTAPQGKSCLDRDETVKQHMTLVSQIARRYARFRPDLFEDLEQVGALGLLKAIQYYDPQKSNGASFKTLASVYIKGEIRHYLRDHSSLVQVPRKYTEINSTLSKLEETLTKQFERSPSLDELSKYSGYSIAEIRDAQHSLDTCSHYESLDGGDEYEDSESRCLSETVPDKRYQDFVLASEDRELLNQAVTRLGERTSRIVEFVFFYDLSQKETAHRLGISEMVVSRAVHSGLKKLRDILATEIL